MSEYFTLEQETKQVYSHFGNLNTEDCYSSYSFVEHDR